MNYAMVEDGVIVNVIVADEATAAELGAVALPAGKGIGDKCPDMEKNTGGGGALMKDRVPLYPGRVKLVPVAGQSNVYDMERADQPTEAGTPLNKASLLKDTTASALGLSAATATPDDALNALIAKMKSEIKKSRPTTYERFMTGRIWGC